MKAFFATLIIAILGFQTLIVKDSQGNETEKELIDMFAPNVSNPYRQRQSGK